VARDYYSTFIFKSVLFLTAELQERSHKEGEVWVYGERQTVQSW